MSFWNRVRLSFVTLLTLAVMPSFAQAATLLNRQDIMSRQQISENSNHEIHFTTPTGVDTNTDTIVVTFPASFNVNSVTVADVDLLHGPVTGIETNEIIAASPAIGVWGLAISGQTFTFTAPSDAGASEIDPSDIVTIRIGTNAGGTNQITNPSSVGTYALSIAGTFGDLGGISLPILSPGSISIGANVAATSTPPPGGGGGGPTTDGTPPILSNIQAINITSNSARIIWRTDEAADSQVDYGVTFFYTSGSVTSSLRVTDHGLDLTGLSPDTVYNFRVTSRDAAGNVAQSGNFTFRTLGPPIISNIRVISITQTTARVLWDTNVPATSLVEFGTSLAYGQTASAPGLTTSHEVFLSGLTGTTLYHFRVHSSEGGGLSAVSGDQTFTTSGDVTPPSNVFAFTATPAIQAINLAWENPPEPDFAFVRIIARTDRYPTNPSDGRLVYQGNGTNTVDRPLTEGIRVYYANFAADVSGNFSSGALADAVPLPPIVTPPTSTPPVIPPVNPPTTTPPVVPPVTPPTSTPPVIPPVTPTSTEPTLPPIIVVTSTEPGTPTTPTSPAVPIINPEYYGSSGNVPLEPDTTGRVGALAGQPILVRIPVTNLPANPQSGTIEIGGARYALTPLPGGEAWGASFIPSKEARDIPATIHFRFDNQTESISQTVIAVQASGRVKDQSSSEGIEGAQLFIFVIRDGQEIPYEAATYGQPYPVVSNPDGSYGLIVPNGRYRIRVEKQGYETKTIEIAVTNNVLSRDIELARSFAWPPILQIFQSEQAKQAARIIAPLAAILTLAVAASALSAFNLLTYLYYLFSQPFLLIGRRKRRKWGVVYNSLTKLPIELAIVRLLDADSKRVLQTHITDNKGRYSFIVRPGRYRLEVKKPGYIFASTLMKGEQVDIDYVDLYYGDTVEVKEETNLTFNIPVDPLVKEEVPRAIRFKKFLRKLQNVLGFVSVILTFIALLIVPSWIIFGLFVVQLITYLLFRRLALPPKPREWGYVHEEKKKGRKLDYAVIRIFDKKYNKLLETQITNKSGKYGFIVGRNNYYITADRQGYDSYRSGDLDLTKPGEYLVDRPIALKQKSPTATQK